MRDAHPSYKQQGVIRALETIKFSINTHQGCYGECNFCAISVHQGRTIRSRSEASILQEAKQFAIQRFQRHHLGCWRPYGQHVRL